HKLVEAQRILELYGFHVEQLITNPILTEIQADTLDPIAIQSVKLALEIHNKPLFVEDSGLFIHSLKGFPGPYSSYVLKTIGLDGILSLMRNTVDRKAEFQAVIAYIHPLDKKVRIFKGITRGKISLAIRGDQWGYDPIFIPHGQAKTYAEMGSPTKNEISHRSKALNMFAKWIQSET
ncbi:MAG: RdgB/HAM1 family non-canonical purine NTP pyrophosphatase, partial [Candidatus Ranarchaeia archaeon]